MGASEKVEQSLTSVFQGGSNEPGSSDQNEVQIGSDAREQTPHGFAEKAFCSITMNGGSHRLASRDPYFQIWLFIALHYQHNKRVGIGLARTPHPLEVFGSGQTKLSLQPSPGTRLK